MDNWQGYSNSELEKFFIEQAEKDAAKVKQTELAPKIKNPLYPIDSLDFPYVQLMQDTIQRYSPRTD